MPPRTGSAALRAAPRPECGIRPVCPAGAPAAAGPAAGPVGPRPHLTGPRAHKPRAAEVAAHVPPYFSRNTLYHGPETYIELYKVPAS